jgi:hypothetical protein
LKKRTRKLLSISKSFFLLFFKKEVLSLLLPRTVLRRGMNALSRPVKAPAQSQTNRLLDVISRSQDANWLAVCRDHNKVIRNEAVTQAAVARLAELAGPVVASSAEPAVRMSAVEQAQAIWAVLAKRAGDTGSTTVAKMTYGDLAVAIGYPHRGAARAIKPALGLIGMYCIKHGLPALNALAVNQASMEAGDSVVLTDGETPRSERASVVAFDWMAVPVPDAASFAGMKAPR